MEAMRGRAAAATGTDVTVRIPKTASTIDLDSIVIVLISSSSYFSPRHDNGFTQMFPAIGVDAEHFSNDLLRERLIGSALRHQPAFGKHQYCICKSCRQPEVVRDHDD